MGSESQSEAVSESMWRPGEAGRGQGQTTYTCCLVGGRANPALLILQLGPREARDTFQIHRAAKGHSQEVPWACHLWRRRGAFLDRTQRPSPQPPPPCATLFMSPTFPRG